MKNSYQPKIMVIEEITIENPEIKSFRFKFHEAYDRKDVTFKAGQFGEFSIFGEGEIALCLTSSPIQNNGLECCVRIMDKVTEAFHRLNPGDRIGFRGPYGNWFPLEKMEGKNLLFIAGGIGLAPLKPLILNCLERREYFGQITILYGAKKPTDFIYQRQLREWGRKDDLTLIKTVDTVNHPGEEAGWDGQIGLVPVVMRDIGLSPINTVALTCGPPTMIKFVIQGLDALGFPAERIFTTLEMKMKCGMGKCGQCRIGKYVVCKDGPVFTYAQMGGLTNEW